MHHARDGQTGISWGGFLKIIRGPVGKTVSFKIELEHGNMLAATETKYSVRVLEPKHLTALETQRLEQRSRPATDINHAFRREIRHDRL
jgi:hypothetical protein